ncbi:MAG TPA: glycosyltransferase [Verrucomicrobiales bacterium]|nr:glycosyltransferase [Verrucomicrobiales bacterium]
MHLSIVIPAFNEEKLLPVTLAAVNGAAGALTEKGITHSVIVCDNNSTDRTAEIARANGAETIFEAVNHISRSRNTGATLATGEWILFLDADSQPSRELFADLAVVLLDESVLFGGCRLVLDEPHGMGNRLIQFWHWLAKKKRWAAGSFFFVRRSAFEAAGGFSTRLYASEEIDLSIRLGRLAKEQSKRFTFLTAHPLVTSARKFRFHSNWWHLRFMLRTLFCGTRNLRRRESCGLWYDGQR